MLKNYNFFFQIPCGEKIPYKRDPKLALLFFGIQMTHPPHPPSPLPPPNFPSYGIGKYFILLLSLPTSLSLGMGEQFMSPSFNLFFLSKG